ncbi:hypothetical protein SAMN04487770_1238 [Butyrivibrio sp. ob235]|uniref:hypothetical protein n=1 Tax=Butyrivibrio sp. ob235 TaxID=1761780 RepID=UPI0008BF2299|nr:hypothetical protein [Butyrivibrio sp. ob235]SEL99959.1 hypothetical protein SAMN04487770_1238 [Butyrivibrio sp. ob235]
MKKRLLGLCAVFAAALIIPTSVSAKEYMGDGYATIPAKVEGERIITTDYKVVLDPYLTLEWIGKNNYEGKYNVSVDGKLAKGYVVKVRPDKQFLVASGNRKINGYVSQKGDLWADKSVSHKEAGIPYSIYRDALPIGNGTYSGATGTARITIPGDGNYEGRIVFNFKVEKVG